MPSIFRPLKHKKADEAAFLIPDFQIVSEFSGGLADRLVLAAGLLIVRRCYIRFINRNNPIPTQRSENAVVPANKIKCCRADSDHLHGSTFQYYSF